MSRRQRSSHKPGPAGPLAADDPAVPFTLPEQPGPRSERLRHLLFEEVDRLFRLEVNDRRLQGVTIVALLLSPDLRNAKVMYAVPEAPAEPAVKSRRRAPAGEKDLLEGLERVTPFLRARVADALSIKRVPELHFHRDRIAEAALRAAKVLQAQPPAPAEQAAEAGASQQEAPPAEGGDHA